jgi:hypothetical protein
MHQRVTPVTHSLHRRRPRSRSAAALLVVSLLGCSGLASCARSASSSDDSRPAVPDNPVPLMESKDPLCRLLSVVLPAMAEDHLTFAELAGSDQVNPHGIGGIVALSLSMSSDSPERFQPILSFIGERAEAGVNADVGQAGEPPKLTQVIHDNAKALDKEIASGRCDE